LLKGRFEICSLHFAELLLQKNAMLLITNSYPESGILLRHIVKKWLEILTNIQTR